MPYGNPRRIILFSLDLFVGLIHKLLIYLIYRNGSHSRFAHKEIIKPSSFKKTLLMKCIFHRQGIC